jgi:hypothetical protein
MINELEYMCSQIEKNLESQCLKKNYVTKIYEIQKLIKIHEGEIENLKLQMSNLIKENHSNQFNLEMKSVKKIKNVLIDLHNGKNIILPINWLYELTKANVHLQNNNIFSDLLLKLTSQIEKSKIEKRVITFEGFGTLESDVPIFRVKDDFVSQFGDFSYSFYDYSEWFNYINSGKYSFATTDGKEISGNITCEMVFIYV